MNDLLLSCLHQDSEKFPESGLNRLTEEQWQTLINLAIEYRVVPLLYQRISSANLSSDEADRAKEQLETYTREVTRKNLRMYGELQRYLNKLNEAGIPVILLKGIYLAHEIYHGKGLREMNDMDLLVAKKDLKQAADILMQLGYEPAKPLHIDYEVKKSHHLPPMIKDQVAVFEIHWNITKPGRSYYIEPDGLWERAKAGNVLNQDVRVLSPEDLLLHLCIHNSHQHMFSFGLRPFCDIAGAIEHYKQVLDWNQFTSLARENGWQKGVYLALLTAKDMVGAAVPETTLHALKPADTNPELLKISKEQVLTEKYVSASIPLTMASAVEEKSLIKKMKTVWGRVFLPQEFMATRYPVKPGSVKIYAYYLVRLWEALVAHSGKIFRIFRGDQKLTGIVARKNTLHRWLNE